MDNYCYKVHYKYNLPSPCCLPPSYGALRPPEKGNKEYKEFPL